jgi:protein TonB
VSDDVTAHDVKDADPLVHPAAPLQQQLLFVAAIAIAALFLHVGATVTISGASWAAGQVGFGSEPEVESVEVAIIDNPVEPEPLPEPEPEPELEEPPEETEPTKEIEKKEPEPEPKKKKQPPPPDPTDIDDAPPEPDKPVRRRVGLNLESTVTDGEGGSYSAGNTRMGETDDKANDPKKIDRRKSPPKKEPPPPPPKEEPNKKAQNIPTKAKVVKPKRSKKVKPDYPSKLRAKGIEGTVVVRVQINAKGKVTKVDIVAKSKHSEFDEAAKAAAMNERFKPATKDGKAISYSLSFSYRFRLND